MKKSHANLITASLMASMARPARPRDLPSRKERRMANKKPTTTKGDLAKELADLHGQVEALKELLGLAVSFHLGHSVYLEARQPKEKETSYRWAIVRHGQIMDATGHWEQEPGPAARTDMLRERYYFVNVMEAIRVYGEVYPERMGRQAPMEEAPKNQCSAPLSGPELEAACLNDMGITVEEAKQVAGLVPATDEERAAIVMKADAHMAEQAGHLVEDATLFVSKLPVAVDA